MPKVKLTIGRVLYLAIATEPHWPRISSILQNFLRYPLSCFSPKIHLQDLWKRFQFVLDHNLGHFEANILDRAEIVMEASKNRRFSGTLEHRSHKSSRASLCWPPMTTRGHNADTLRTDIPTILSSPVFSYITRGVLTCLLGFLALCAQKSCRGNYLMLRPGYFYTLLLIM